MKYNNRKTFIGAEVFDSAKEARRWQELVLMERAGVIADLQRQVPFILIPAQKVNGKTVEKAVKYVADFVYTENGQTVVEDTKSHATRTPVYVVKRKLMLQVYGIMVKEV